MKVFLIILIVLILISVFLLVARICLSIDTEKGIYRLSFGRILSASFVWSPAESPRIRIRILFIPFKIRPWLGSGHKDKGIEKKRRKRPLKPYRILRWFLALVSSLHVDHFEADIDTGDYPLNAQLIPLAYLARNADMNIKINFEDRNSLDCRVQTRPVITLWKYLTKNY